MIEVLLPSNTVVRFFRTDRSAPPPVGEPSLRSPDVSPTVTFGACRSGQKLVPRNDDKAGGVLAVI